MAQGRSMPRQDRRAVGIIETDWAPFDELALHGRSRRAFRRQTVLPHFPVQRGLLASVEPEMSRCHPTGSWAAIQAGTKAGEQCRASSRARRRKPNAGRKCIIGAGAGRLATIDDHTRLRLRRTTSTDGARRCQSYCRLMRRLVRLRPRSQDDHPLSMSALAALQRSTR